MRYDKKSSFVVFSEFSLLKVEGRNIELIYLIKVNMCVCGVCVCMYMCMFTSGDP